MRWRLTERPLNVIADGRSARSDRPFRRRWQCGGPTPTWSDEWDRGRMTPGPGPVGAMLGGTPDRRGTVGPTGGGPSGGRHADPIARTDAGLAVRGAGPAGRTPAARGAGHPGA